MAEFTTWRYPETGWDPSGRLVELAWLPLTGPTAYCALRAIHAAHDAILDDAGVPLRWDADQFAQSLGVRPKLVLHALDRLVRFRLATRQDDSYGFPTAVGPMSAKEWHRLPEQARTALSHALG